MEIITADWDRQLRADWVAVRHKVAESLETLRFAIDRIEGNTISAHRGLTATLQRARGSRTAMTARVVVLNYKSHVKLVLRLAETESVLLDIPSALARYRDGFLEIMSAIDDCLRQLDPSLSGFLPELNIKVDDRDHSRRRQLSQMLQDKAGNVLRKDAMTEPVLRLLVDGEQAEINRQDLQSLATVTAMSMTDPDLPTSMLDEAHALRERLVGRRSEPGQPIVATITARERKLMDFLFRQASVRQTLPVRELYVCRDCGHTRIVNPDYRDAVQKNRSINVLVGGAAGIASAFATGGITAFGLASRLVGTRQADFVCARCQGTRPIISLITICPKCQQIAAQPVLRICRTEGCGYNFLQGTRSLVWREHAAGDAQLGLKAEEQAAGNQVSSPPSSGNSAVVSGMNALTARGLERTAGLLSQGKKKYGRELTTGMARVKRQFGKSKPPDNGSGDASRS